MNALFYFLIWAAILFLMMRFGCGAHGNALRFLMEYDNERSGGLEPLRLLPKGKQRVMPGFVTTKTPELETMDYLKRKFDEAASFTDIDQLGIARRTLRLLGEQEDNSIDARMHSAEAVELEGEDMAEDVIETMLLLQHVDLSRLAGTVHALEDNKDPSFLFRHLRIQAC